MNRRLLNRSLLLFALVSACSSSKSGGPGDAANGMDRPTGGAPDTGTAPGPKDGGPAAADTGPAQGMDATSPGRDATAPGGMDAAPGGTDANPPAMDAMPGPMDAMPNPDAQPPPSASVLQHHNHASRDGVYVDPAFTRQAAVTLHHDATFNAPLTGQVYAQPLYFANGPGGHDLVIAVTEANEVIAFDAANGSVVWHRTPIAPPAPHAQLPCGNIMPNVGITGTPVIDPTTRTLYFDAMTMQNTAPTFRHMVYALSLDDGSTRSGWPVDMSTVHTPGGVMFVSAYQGERGALALVNGTLYIPYGGHWGDCTDMSQDTYHGWIVGISTTNPTQILAWATRGLAGGMWTPAGISSDGTNLYDVTGNTYVGADWMDGEAVFKFQPGPVFSGQNTDFYAPPNWKQLDIDDKDLTGTSPIIFDAPGATPSQLLFTMDKNGHAYLLNRNNMGGLNMAGSPDTALYNQQVSTDTILSTAAAYTTPSGTYVVYQAACPQGHQGDLTALKVTAANPPQLTFAWCATLGSQGNYSGSPIVTMTDAQGTDAIVWAVAAEGDQVLRGFNADTGAVIFNGGVSGDAITNVQHFQVPIAANGRIFVAGNDRVWAMTLR